MTSIKPFKIEESFGFILNRSSIVLRKKLTQTFKNNDIDLTPESFSLLSRLWEENGITQSSLVDKTIKDKAIVTRLLNTLTSKGYVYKEINPNDRRNHLVYLSKEGLELKKQILPMIFDLMNLATHKIPCEDMETTLKVLKQIFENLDQ